MVETSRTDRLSFTAEWYDAESSLLKKFILFFFTSDNTIELFDTKTKRTFLKRTFCEGVNAEHIYVGNTIIVFARQIVIKGYADEVTRKQVEHKMQRTFGMIKPDGIKHKGKILKLLISNGFKLSKLKMVHLTKEIALELYTDLKGEAIFPFVIDLMTSGPVIAMELMARNGVEKLIQLLGPSDPTVARTEAPDSIRALFGKDTTNNAAHAAKSSSNADKECKLFFPPNDTCKLTTAVSMKNSTCCVVKPHAVKEGKLGEIVSFIEDNSYNITGMQMFYLDLVNAEEFLEIYKGIVPDYLMMVQQLASGPCVALEVSGRDDQTPVKFRELVGPSDPEIGRHLRPHTLRAHFGINKVENAVHVTDLAEDALLEVEYFFKLLSC